jgi:HK97 family phage prohead protease
MELERREFRVALKIETREGGNSPVIRGHAAVFNSLSENLGGFREMVAPGAFTEAIKSDDVRALFNHNPDYILGRNISKTLRLSEDKEGLSIEIDPPETNVAKDLLISIERGDVDQMSFGFRVRPNGEAWGEDEEGNVIRTLTDVKLFDVSPVTYPAYPQTDVAVRSLNCYLEDANKNKSRNIIVLRKKLELLELNI